ncbi:MAG: AI-2E family transporter [Bacteroidetes bacterium]|nr:AI-2E family transporter [Bacteroidales bacterium]MBU1010244.1 AI-2E family transporter [Bacteroidota bacterium]
MNGFISYIKPFTGLIIIGIMGWYFSDLLIYIVISAVLSIIGKPLVKWLNRLKLGKYQMPNTLSAVLTLMTIVMGFLSFIFFIIPLINKQAIMIAEIDTLAINKHFAEALNSIQNLLISYRIMEPEQSINSLIEANLTQLVKATNVSAMFTKLIGATSTLMMGVFIILFLTFFFLKEKNLLRLSILAIIPEKYTIDMGKLLTDTRTLLTRYFLGLLMEIGVMMTIIGLTLSVLGVRNALIIGFLGGLMNVIPYLGPIIGACIGILLGVISVLSLGMYDALFPTMLTILLTFAGANLIDNFLLQPIIYSKSVKAHPVEIFLVIIMAGKLAGIGGMVLAIPVYTVIRLIARQFLSSARIVAAITRNMN